MTIILLLSACTAPETAELLGPGECTVGLYSVENKQANIPITSRWELGGVVEAAGDCQVYCDDPWASIELRPLEQEGRYEVMLRGSIGLLEGAYCFVGVQMWTVGCPYCRDIWGR